MKLNIYDKKIMHQIGTPFWYWAGYGQFTITEIDLEYLQFIKGHPCFSVLRKYSDEYISRLEWINTRINEIVFYEHFYNDPNCPQGVKNILFIIIGHKRHALEDIDMLSLLDFRYHSVELWLDSVT